MNSNKLCTDTGIHSPMANRFRILAVDDEQDMLDTYKDAFSLANPQSEANYEFDVVLRDQGDRAVEAVREAQDHEQPFAVVFLDMKMPPGPDGLWTGKHIRMLDPYVNFVIVTGFLDVDPREIVSRIPPEDKILYVQKPFHIRELRQFAAALGTKWQSERLLRKTNEVLEKKVKQLETSQRELLDNKLKLENLNNQLMETNNALSVLARNLDRTRKESERSILQRTRTLILPVLEKLLQDKGLEKYGTDLSILVSNVENLGSDFSNGMKPAHSLSASELRIAAMIRNGMSSEEIARHLCISPSTVKTHRKNIRKKLDLRNSGTHLRAYLESTIDRE